MILLPGVISNHQGSNTTTTTTTTTMVSNKRLSVCCYVLVRIILLDIPLVLVIGSYGIMVWIRYVQEHYLYPQYIAAKFDEDRSWKEITYYKRTCDVHDMSTTNGNDLFLPMNATVDEAYQHQIKHGFTVFRNVLKEETAMALRRYIDQRNKQLKDDEKIFVLSGTNRYSFGLGTEEPTVVTAVKEVATSIQLRPALEKIVGIDPALIEMTAITASYGAVAQEWHDDVIADGSAINYGRTFGPSYSIFIQLQNTTAAMGATNVCPGTHYCSHGEFDKFCQNHGFPLTNEYEHWNAGDALLMNMNSYHRGGAHIDSNAVDRVMFILTFTPKPIRRAEIRQMSQGITFSLRWDMWGHTLSDLVNADTIMKQPYAILRSLGLYKPSTVQSSWGIDYISGTTMRMSNNDVGFRRSDLDEFITRGGLKFLPRWLQGSVDIPNGESWYEYITRTFTLCFQFSKKICITSIIGYISICTIITYKFQGTISSQDRKSSIIVMITAGAVFRVASIISIVTVGYWYVIRYVDQSDWAIDIKAGRRYSRFSQYDEHAFHSYIAKEYNIRNDVVTSLLPSTLPTKYDILIETRYGSKQLALYNDYITNHPGNVYLNELVQQQRITFAHYSSPGGIFQDAIAKYIVSTVGLHHGRFLLQNPVGQWIWMSSLNNNNNNSNNKNDSSDAVIHYVKKELVQSTNPLLKEILQTIRFIESDGRYGIFRDTVLQKHHASYNIYTMKMKLINNVMGGSNPSTRQIYDDVTTQSNVRYFFQKVTTPPVLQSSASSRHPKKRLVSLLDNLPNLVVEPYEGAWIAAGDTIEAWGDNYWYHGMVKNVSAYGLYHIIYLDGSEEDIDQYTIRPFIPYQINEQVEAQHPDDYYFYKGIVVNINSQTNDRFAVYIPQFDEIIYDIPLNAMRRYGESKLPPDEPPESAYY